MKVAVVIPTHWDYLMGGAQYQAKLLIDVLNQRTAVDVAYLASRVPADPHAGNCRIVPVGRYRFVHRYGYFWDARALWQTLSREQPDVIYQRVGCAYTGICGAYARRHGIRMVWHIAHDSNCQPLALTAGNLRRPHWILEKKFLEHGLRRATSIIAQTNDQAEQLKKNYGRSPDAVIRNFHPVPDKAEKSTGIVEVLWIANLKPVKRPELLLELAERMQGEAGVRFTMIGAPYLDAAKQAVFLQRLARVKNVSYVGELTQSEVNARLAKAQVMVSTSRAEGFSNTFIQAWLSGVPVLSLNVNPDGLLDGGPLGRSVADVAEMAQVLAGIVAERASLRERGEAAREFAIAEFGLQNAEQLADIVLS